MSGVENMEISKTEKFKVMYLNFFPVVFMPFTTLYLLVNGDDPKGYFLANILISITLLLVPLLANICMITAKYLFKKKNKNVELYGIGLGLLCLLFMVGSIFYQYFKFVEQVIPLDKIYLSFSLGILLSCFLSSIWFAVKYISFIKQYNVTYNVKTSRFIVAGMTPILIAILTQLIMQNVV